MHAPRSACPYSLLADNNKFYMDPTCLLLPKAAEMLSFGRQLPWLMLYPLAYSLSPNPEPYRMRTHMHGACGRRCSARKPLLAALLQPQHRRGAQRMRPRSSGGKLPRMPKRGRSGFWRRSKRATALGARLFSRYGIPVSTSSDLLCRVYIKLSRTLL